MYAGVHTCAHVYAYVRVSALIYRRLREGDCVRL